MRRCPECGKQALIAVTIPHYSTEMEHDGRKYPVDVSDFAVHQCQECGEILSNEDANDKLVEALRAAAGLLSAGDIRSRRRALGYKQDAMASLLGISPSTLSRWENGAQLQQRCMDRILRAFFEVKEFREFLTSNYGPSLPVEVASARLHGPSSYASLFAKFAGMLMRILPTSASSVVQESSNPSGRTGSEGGAPSEITAPISVPASGIAQVSIESSQPTKSEIQWLPQSNADHSKSSVQHKRTVPPLDLAA